MKKLIYIGIIALSILATSCKKEENPETKEKDCNCGIVTNVIHYTINVGTPKQIEYYEFTRKNNCTDKLETSWIKSNTQSIRVGDENCGAIAVY